MKRIFSIFLFSLSAIGADTPVAIVKGTNVLGTTVCDLARFDPTKVAAGASNVFISTHEVSVIEKGWSYSGGVFRDPNGAGLPADVVAKKAREEKAKAFVTKYNERKSEWYTLKVSEQGDVLGRLCALIETILELHPELLEPKETSQ